MNSLKYQDVEVPHLGETQHLVKIPNWVKVSVPILSIIMLASSIGVGLVSEQWWIFYLGIAFIFLIMSLVTTSLANRSGSRGRLRILQSATGIWISESKSAAIWRLVTYLSAFLSSIPAIAVIKPVIFGLLLPIVFAAGIIDALFRLRDRRQLGITQEGIQWRSHIGTTITAQWGGVGAPSFGASGELYIPTEVGIKRIARFDTNSDIRAVWGLVNYYRTSKTRRIELTNGGHLLTITSGALPLPRSTAPSM